MGEADRRAILGRRAALIASATVGLGLTLSGGPAVAQGEGGAGIGGAPTTGVTGGDGQGGALPEDAGPDASAPPDAGGDVTPQPCLCACTVVGAER